MIAFMHKNQPGISFIEILVILLLMSLMLSLSIPRFLSRKPRMEQLQFFEKFATMVSQTAHQAIITGKIHQIFFNIKDHMIMVKQHDSQSDETSKHQQFKHIHAGLFTSSIQLPQRFIITNFFIQGFDETRVSDTMNEAWFYVMPDGSSQRIIINFTDDDDQHHARFCFTINPFYSQVKFHETFQTP